MSTTFKKVVMDCLLAQPFKGCIFQNQSLEQPFKRLCQKAISLDLLDLLDFSKSKS
jgi:hypothetical protein